jgi:acetate---CoA ligase (ADP-forming) subunit beta
MQRIVKEALCLSRSVLIEPEAKEILRLSGVAVPKYLVAKDVAGALEAAESIGYPLVLKLVSPDVLHKSEAGGVALNIRNRDELERKWSEMILCVADEHPTALIEGFLLEEMVPGGTEIIVGGLNDPQFGPCVMFGIGGVAAELMRDVSFRLAPVTREEAFEMMGEVKGFPLLTGFRGAPVKDLGAIADVILKIAGIMEKVDGLKEFEINPLIVHERGAVAVDARGVIG